ncbi:MAG TPA: shikimate kinase [Edaphocola sp.]|nr:shikimate kinase [Edaphocola sp.]
MLLFLTGMPGAGKTFWLNSFAEALQYQTADLDQFIEERQGCSIPVLFQRGEGYFRRVEKEALDALVQARQNTVIATGGGTPCHEDNMAKMKQNGMTVYLQASVRQLCQRLAQDVSSRPLLAQLTSRELYCRLEAILSGRQYFYRQSDIVFNTETDNFAHIIAQIQSLQRQNNNSHV